MTGLNDTVEQFLEEPSNGQSSGEEELSLPTEWDLYDLRPQINYGYLEAQGNLSPADYNSAIEYLCWLHSLSGSVIKASQVSSEILKEEESFLRTFPKDTAADLKFQRALKSKPVMRIVDPASVLAKK